MFIIVILQSLVSSLMSIVRERERERKKNRETEKCVMLLTIKIRQPVWWHSYSKIMVCLLLWNICLKFGQDPNIHNLACTQGAVAVIIVKHNYQKNYLHIKFINKWSTVMVITEEVGHISCLPSCILSCRALSADSLQKDAALIIELVFETQTCMIQPAVKRQLQLKFIKAILAIDEVTVIEGLIKC